MTVTKGLPAFKVQLHTADAGPKRKYDENDIFVFNKSDHPQLKVGDLVMIVTRPKDCDPSTPSTSTVRSKPVIVNVNRLYDDFTTKKTVSILRSVGERFDIRKDSDVCVVCLSPDREDDLRLDMVELIFREQYLSRADMYRFSKWLLNRKNRSLYQEKALEFAGIRCTVGAMWSRGVQLSCGLLTARSCVDVVPKVSTNEPKVSSNEPKVSTNELKTSNTESNDDTSRPTRVVFRSASAQCFIFIQLSAEMWQFDTEGDLYLEKVLTGFLPDLFRKWNAERCSHYVTIVVFSRYYFTSRDAKLRRNEPDHRGRVYRDFYRIIVQNEHYKDWMPHLAKLRPLINQYREAQADYFARRNLPTALNSTAEEGNFLEAINMAMNVFSKHQSDRTFERTGQMQIVITPGVGVFSVDRDLSRLTKQRVMDFGIALDLVCLGEQPLHAVPLFILHDSPLRFADLPQTPGRQYFNTQQQQTVKKPTASDYNVPHWMNYSYYNPPRCRRDAITFVPRLRIARALCEVRSLDVSRMFDCLERNNRLRADDTEDVDFNFAEYDRQLVRKQSDDRPNRMELHRHRYQTYTFGVHDQDARLEDAGHGAAAAHGRSSDVLERRQTADNYSLDEPTSPELLPTTDSLSVPAFERNQSNIVGSVDSASTSLEAVSLCSPVKTFSNMTTLDVKLKKEDFNPLRPADYVRQMSSNRRRWIHVFPTDADGKAKQAHHFRHFRQRRLSKDEPRLATIQEVTAGGVADRRKSQLWAWGVTGEERWNPELQIGVDWQSFTNASILPLTTDFFPDPQALQSEYNMNVHDVVDDVTREDFMDYWQCKSVLHVYAELVYQRLQQGFQIIEHKNKEQERKRLSSLKSFMMTVNIADIDSAVSTFMNVGQIYHVLVLFSRQHIKIIRMAPKNMKAREEVRYEYEFQIPDEEDSAYSSASTAFRHDGLEQHPWPMADEYIARKGTANWEDESQWYSALMRQEDIEEKLRMWRARFMLVPCKHPGIESILAEIECRQKEGALEDTAPGGHDQGEAIRYKDAVRVQCDRFDTLHEGKEMRLPVLIDGFHRFMELINNVKRRRSDSGETPSFMCRYEAMEKKTTEAEAADAEVVTEAMLNPSSGVSFLEATNQTVLQRALPDDTFTSAEFVYWSMSRFSDINKVDDAIELGRRLLQLDRIASLTNAESKDFVFGFHLYVIVGKDSSKLSMSTEWPFLEAAISENTKGIRNVTDGDCAFMLKTRKFSPLSRALCSDEEQLEEIHREEWARLSLPNTYCPEMAFEVSIAWLVSTGFFVGDLINTWSRRTYHDDFVGNFHLIPVPFDPFAFIYNTNSDPLRRPLVSTLDMSVFAKLGYSIDEAEVKNIQSCILKRFGFLPMSCEKHGRLQEKHGRAPAKSSSSQAKQFVHLSGAMFVLVKKNDFNWAWNAMLGQRYRDRKRTGDTVFEDTMYSDFLAFCSNANDRLESFIVEYFAAKQ